MRVLYANSCPCDGMDVQVTSVPIDSDTLAALGAFQFNIALKVPWVMRSIVVRASGCLHGSTAPRVAVEQPRMCSHTLFLVLCNRQLVETC